MPDDLQKQLQGLSPESFQKLTSAVNKIRTGQAGSPDDFDMDAVGKLWEQVKPGSELSLRAAGQPAVEPEAPWYKTAFHSVMGLVPRIPVMTLDPTLRHAPSLPMTSEDIIQPVKEYQAAGAKGVAGMLAGASATEMAEEAAKGHTKTIAVQTGVSTAAALLGLAVPHLIRKARIGGVPEAATSGELASTAPRVEAPTSASAGPTVFPKISAPAAPISPAEIADVKAATGLALSPEAAQARIRERQGQIWEPAARPAPVRDAAQVIDAVNTGVRPKRLSDPELRRVAVLNEEEAKDLGLKRDDLLAARAEAGRRFGPAQIKPETTPHEAVHQTLFRVVKDPANAESRMSEFQAAVEHAGTLAPEARERLLTTLDSRADAAARQVAEIQRVVAAQDYNKEITSIRRENLASRVVSGESVGFDPKTGKAVVVPELDPETGAPVAGARVPRFVSAISQERRQLLGLIAGETQGRFKLMRDPETGKAMPLPKLSPEQAEQVKSFVGETQGKLNNLLREVWAQGQPTEAQLAEGEKYIGALQAATGKRFLYTGKKSFTVDNQGVVSYPGVDPNQAYWNKIMGRPETSHFAKPTADLVEKRVLELRLEGMLAKKAASRLRAVAPVEEAATVSKGPEPTVVKPADTVTVYHGEGAPGGAGGGALWFSRNPERAASYGGQVHAVEVPRAIFEAGQTAARKAGSGTSGDAILPAEYSKQGKPVSVPASRYELGEPEAAKPFIAKVYDEEGKQIGTREVSSVAPPVKPIDTGAAAEDLAGIKRHLVNLENKGLGETDAAKRVRAAIAEYEKAGVQVPVSKTVLEDIGYEMKRQAERAEAKVAPKRYSEPYEDRTAMEGKGDDLIALLGTGTAEEVSRPLHSAIMKLHEKTLPEDRDFLAYTAIESAKDAGIGEIARRYGRSLQLLRQGLEGGKGAAALQEAAHFAQTGKAYPAKLGAYIAPTFLQDIANELGRYAVNGVVKGADVAKMAGRWLDEGTYADVSRQSRDAMFKFRGELMREQDLGRIAFNEAIGAVRAMAIPDQIDLLAKAQRGEPMPTPDLQAARDMLQQLEDRSYIKMRALRPGLSYWRDHIGTIWSKPPAHAAELYARHAEGVNRAVLQGDRGMLRRRIYETVKEGMDRGGVPATTNLFEMGLLDLGRQAQFIHANDVLLPELKRQGRLVKGEVALNEALASGTLQKPVRVPDNVVSSWFPVETAEGGTAIAKGPSWYMEKGELQMLQRWLAPDFIRRNVVGRAIVNFKNVYTPIELLGPFHAASMVFKSAALGVAQGMNRAFNVGVLQGESAQIIRGLGEAIDGLRIPYKAFREGRALMEAGGQSQVAWQKYQFDKQNFLNTPAGQRLQKLYPNLEDVIDGVLEGGGHIGVNPDYATRWRQSMVQAWKEQRYIASTAQIPFTAVEAFTKPLFQTYIPALKLGAMAREISVELRRQGPRIQSGEVSRGQVLQQAVRRVDNILGELNWDNLNMSRTMKTLLQFAYRSPGWRMGTLDLVKNSAWGQAREFYNTAALQRIPTIDPNLLYLMSSVTVGAAAATTFMALFAKKAPTNIVDLTNPQTGQVDSRGKPIRLDLPLYTSRDVPEILTAPGNYITGGQSGPLSRTIEAFKNRTFQGTMIAEPGGGLTGAAKRGIHAALPKPFIITGYERMSAQGFGGRKAVALNIAGLNPSRRDLDMTESERILAESERRTIHIKTAEEQEKYQLKQAMQGAYLNGRYDDLRKLQERALREKVMTWDEVGKAIETARTPYLSRMAAAKDIRPQDLFRAYAAGSESERHQLIPFIWKAIERNPQLAPEFRKVQ